MAKSSWRRNFGWWLASFAVAIKIFWLSGADFSSDHTAGFLRNLLQSWGIWIPPGVFALAHLLIRKVAHVCEYALFSVLVYRAISESGWIWQRSAAKRAFTIASVWAALDELHQHFVRGRSAALPDFLLDATGAGLGLAAVFLASSIRHTRPMPASDPAREIV